MPRTLLALTLAVLLAPAAEARIVVQRSIAGVAIDMTRAEVLETKGDPTRRSTTGPSDERYTVWEYGKALTVTFRHKGPLVTGVMTTKPGQRTRSGLGVGSTLAQLRSGLRGEHCNDLGCGLGTMALGTINTFFGFGADGGGVVELVTISRQRSEYRP